MQDIDDFFQDRITQGRNRYLQKDIRLLLEKHSADLKAREQQSHIFFWTLLRFSNDSQVQYVSDAAGLTTEAANEQLSQLLSESTKGYQFQILIRRVGHHAPFSSTEFEILDSVYNIPEVVWRSVLFTSLPKKAYYSQEVFQNSGVLHSEADALFIGDSYLCVPTNELDGPCKTVILFLCQPDLRYSRWWPGDVLNKQDKALQQHHLKNPIGEYGMLKWISLQAKHRACFAEEDFAFLCAEALLRAELQAVGLKIESLRNSQFNKDVSTSGGGRPRTSLWLEVDIRLVTIRNTMDSLLGWLEDHVHGNGKDGESFRTKRMVRYRHAADALDRLLQVHRHNLDLAYASLGAINAFESIRETRFSKILTVLAMVYLPVSIASSIFGMNIQELNGQGLQIHWFVVTIFITMGALLLCWFAFALITNQRSEIKAQGPPVDEYFYPMRARPWRHRFWGIGYSRERAANWPGRMQKFIRNTYYSFQDSFIGIRRTPSQG